MKVKWQVIMTVGLGLWSRITDGEEKENYIVQNSSASLAHNVMKKRVIASHNKPTQYSKN
jgi:hypothetical protein